MRALQIVNRGRLQIIRLSLNLLIHFEDQPLAVVERRQRCRSAKAHKSDGRRKLLRAADSESAKTLNKKPQNKCAVYHKACNFP